MSRERASAIRLQASAGALLLALGAAACDPKPTGPAKPPPASEAQRATAITNAYAAWTEEDTNSAACAVYFAACADSFQRRTGYDPQDLTASNPRAFMQNPDPKWIPGWERIPTDPSHRHVTFAALTYAAAMKAHFAKCTADHDKLEADRAKAMAFMNAKVAELGRQRDVYQRLSGYVGLRSQLKRDFPSPVGPRYTLELAIYDEFVKAERTLVYDLQNQRAEDVAQLRPAFAVKDELDLVCAENIPAWQDPESVPLPYVFAPLPSSRVEELRAKVAKARDLESKIPTKTVAVPTLNDAPAPDRGALVSIAQEALGVPLSVKKVVSSPDKAGITVELEGKASKKDVFYDCKDSDRPDKVDEGGKIRFERSCKKRDETKKLTLVVVLAEPPDFPIQKDDKMVVLAKFDRLESKESKLGAGVLVEQRCEVTGFQVLEIWRQNLLVADYFVQ